MYTAFDTLFEIVSYYNGGDSEVIDDNNDISIKSRLVSVWGFFIISAQPPCNATNGILLRIGWGIKASQRNP